MKKIKLIKFFRSIKVLIDTFVIRGISDLIMSQARCWKWDRELRIKKLEKNVADLQKKVKQ